MPGIHAFLSASSAACWIACPGSAHMRAIFPEKSGTAANEGTLAHELAALLIEGGGEADTSEIAKRIDKFYEDHKELHGDFTSMLRIIKSYVDFVLEEYNAAKKADASAQLCTEQRVDFSSYVPGGFGTSDVIIVSNNEITVIDLKYGKGVPVSAKDNPQIRLYALGAIDLFDLVYEFDRVRMFIYQPRLDSVTEDDMSVDDLQTWGSEVIRPAAAAASATDPAYHAGPWCASKFCPGITACRAHADYIYQIEKYEKDPALLSREEISDALTRSKVLDGWTKKLEEFTLSEIQAGREVPGWKVVEGMSRRKYENEDAAADALIKAGYKKALIYKAPELLGITDMTKLLGKKEFNKLLEAPGLVVKPQGKPTLAPDTDPRGKFNANMADEFDS